MNHIPINNFLFNTIIFLSLFLNISAIQNINFTTESSQDTLYIDGYVLDLNNNPINDVLITARINKIETTTYTDESGYYKLPISYGVVIVKASKYGYKSKGNVKRIHTEKKIKPINFTLDEKLGEISGYITDGVFPLPNISVILTDSNNGFYYSCVSNADGLFNFSALSISGTYNIYIDHELFQTYSAKQLYVLENSNIQHNIILIKNFFNLIIEVYDSQLYPMSFSDVVINDKKYTTDINGFVDTYFNYSKNQITLDISIPKYNFRESYYIIPNIDYPLKIKIIL